MRAYEFINESFNSEFKKWFGDSKVVDDRGNPLLVYHGTNSKFKEFSGDAFFFTDDFRYAKSRGRSHLISAYLSLEDPKIVEIEEGWSIPIIEMAEVRRAKAEGYDIVILVNAEDNDRFYVAFDPKQIKVKSFV